LTVLIVIPTVAHPLVRLALAAAGAGREGLSPNLALAVLGIPFAGIGALAYFGVWRRWARRHVYSPYKLIPLGLWWMGVAFLVSGLTAVVPESIVGYVLLPCLAFGLVGFVGMVWLPRPLLPRWYKIEKGLLPASAEKRVVPSASARGESRSRAPLDEDLRGEASRGFGAASRLGGVVGGAVPEATPDVASDHDRPGAGRGGPPQDGAAAHPTSRRGDG
jgi:hypothetical protein